MMHKKDNPELVDALLVKKVFEGLAVNLYEGIARKNLQKSSLMAIGQLKNDYEYLTYKEASVSSAYLGMGYAEVLFSFYNFSPMKKLYAKQILMAEFARIVCDSKARATYRVANLEAVLKGDLYSVYLKTVDEFLSGLDENGQASHDYEMGFVHDVEAEVAEYMKNQQYYLN